MASWSNDVTRLERRTQKFVLPSNVGEVTSSVSDDVTVDVVGEVTCVTCGGRMTLDAGARKRQEQLLTVLATAHRDVIAAKQCAIGQNDDGGGMSGLDLSAAALVPNHFVAVDGDFGCQCCVTRGRCSSDAKIASNGSHTEMLSNNVPFPVTMVTSSQQQQQRQRQQRNMSLRCLSSSSDDDEIFIRSESSNSLDSVLSSLEYEEQQNTTNNHINCYSAQQTNTTRGYQSTATSRSATKQCELSKAALKSPQTCLTQPPLELSPNKTAAQSTTNGFHDNFEHECDKVIQLANDQLQQRPTSRDQRFSRSNDDTNNNNNNKDNEDVVVVMSLDELTLSLDKLTASLSDASVLSDSQSSDDAISDSPRPHQLAFDYSIFDEMEDKLQELLVQENSTKVVSGSVISEEDSNNTKVVAFSQKKVRVVPDDSSGGQVKVKGQGHVVKVNISDRMMHDPDLIQCQLSQTVRQALDTSTRRQVLESGCSKVKVDNAEEIKRKDEETACNRDAKLSSNRIHSTIGTATVKEEVIVLQETTVVLSYPKNKNKQLHHQKDSVACKPLQETGTLAIDNGNHLGNNNCDAKPVREMLVKRHTKISDLPPTTSADVINNS